MLVAEAENSEKPGVRLSPNRRTGVFTMSQRSQQLSRLALAILLALACHLAAARSARGQTWVGEQHGVTVTVHETLASGGEELDPALSQLHYSRMAKILLERAELPSYYYLGVWIRGCDTRLAPIQVDVRARGGWYRSELGLPLAPVTKEHDKRLFLFRPLSKPDSIVVRFGGLEIPLHTEKGG